MGRTDQGVYFNWSDYILGEIAKKSQLLAQLPLDKNIGTVKISEIVNILPALSRVLGALQGSLSEQHSPSFGHGDAHFRNFIAGSDQHSRWKIKSMIDTEEALGGDPEIDIASIENWLHFSPYKQDFYRHKSDFVSGYQNVRQVSEHYPNRRLIYHAVRSMSYLQTVFNFDAQEFMSADPRNREYVKKHFEILRSLADGNALEDLGIIPLI